MSKSDQILVAKSSFSTEVEGEVYVVHAGVTRVHADHPLAKANPDYFEPVDDSVSYGVEQATAAPSEKRGQRAQETAPPEPRLLEESSDAVPLEGYEELNAKQVLEHLKSASSEEVEAIKAYEATHQNRKTVLGFEPASDQGSA